MRALKNILLYGLARLLLGLLGLLPIKAALGLGRALGRLGGHLARPERLRAEANLRGTLAELDQADRRRLVRGMFAHLGEAVAECAQLGKLVDQVSFEPGSRELLLAALAEGRGVLLVTGHLGNWELMAAALARVVRDAAVLFLPSYDPRFTRLLSSFRAGSGLQCIDVTRAGYLIEALAVLRRGGALGLLIDQPPPRNSQGLVTIDFLGQPAPTGRLAPVLARRARCAVVAAFSRRTGTCQHRVSIERLQDHEGWEKPARALRILAAPLEAAILRAPQQWAWSLDRWRVAPSRQKSSPYCK